MSEIWQTCLVFITEEEGRIEATYLEEPMVIFKLLKVTVNFHLLMCDPVECSENNFSDDIAEINQLIYVNAFEHISENSYDKVTSMNCVHTKTCPAITEKKEKMRQIWKDKVDPTLSEGPKSCYKERVWEFGMRRTRKKV